MGDQNQDGLTGYKKQGKWIVEISGRMQRIDVAGDICLRKPRHTEGCRADDDDDDDDRLIVLVYQHDNI